MKTFNQLKKNLREDFSGLEPVKTALLGDSATQFLSMAFRGFGYDKGLNIELFEAEYDQVDQNILNSESDLYQFAPDYVWLVLSAQKLQQKFYGLNQSQKESFARDTCDYLASLYDELQKTLACKVILNNFLEADDKIFGSYAGQVTSSWLYQVRKLNFELMELTRGKENLFLNDVLTVQNNLGYENVQDSKLAIMSTMTFSIDALPQIAQGAMDIVLCHLGRFTKCVVLDLDNTLWGGVVGDDGLEGIELGDLGVGRAFVEFQRWLLQLRQRGILLAVCSKNEESIARQVFEKHSDMVLTLDDISCFVANWDNKVDNINLIQQTLNIGFDSMVFLDDSPFERNIVRENIPDIRVPELPEDPVEYVDYLRSLNLFETVSYTATDKDRTAAVQVESKRKTFQKSFTSHEDFLGSLDMQGSIEPFNARNTPRVSQLTLRSNQYNLRTVRYTESEISNVCDNDKYLTFAVNLKDKYGDYGLISAVLGEIREKELFLDTWIMSCRVLKRGVEQFLLNQILEAARQKGLEKVTGEFIPTPKNKLVTDHYEKLKFDKSGDLWSYDLARTDSYSHHIKPF